MTKQKSKHIKTCKPGIDSPSCTCRCHIHIPWQSRLRDEFDKLFKNLGPVRNKNTGALKFDDIADWWILRIEELMK